MKQLIFLTLFILTLVYATQLAVHDEWTTFEEQLEIPEQDPSLMPISFYKPTYCGMESFTEEEDHYKLTMKLCED